MKTNPHSQPATNTLRAVAQLLSEDRGLGPGETRGATMKKAGFDVSALQKRVTESIQQARGRNELTMARSKRQTLGQRVQELMGRLPKIPDPRAAVKRLLEDGLTGRPQAAVMFRKLEETKDSDLESLLEDIALLDFIDEGTNTDRK